MIFTDQLNRKLELLSTPKRIISLVPSQTELLYDLGLRDEVVGITKFCVHPDEWFRNKTRVGGTKKYDLEKIKALQPDLIIGNKEENEKEPIEELMKDHKVWMSDIHNLKEALDMIGRIGVLVGKNEEATNIRLRIEAAFHNLQPVTRNPQPKTAYFIWRKPYMVAGHTTFINEMLTFCGFQNVFSDRVSRYPEITNEDILSAKPELILLSSEPYPFKMQHVQEFQDLLPDAKIMTVDGEMFSWYGSRMLQAPDYFRGLIQKIL